MPRDSISLPCERFLVMTLAAQRATSRSLFFSTTWEPEFISPRSTSAVEPHGLTAVAPLHRLRRAEPSEAYPPCLLRRSSRFGCEGRAPRLRRVPTSHSSTGLHPWPSAKEGKKRLRPRPPDGLVSAGHKGWTAYVDRSRNPSVSPVISFTTLTFNSFATA